MSKVFGPLTLALMILAGIVGLSWIELLIECVSAPDAINFATDNVYAFHNNGATTFITSLQRTRLYVSIPLVVILCLPRFLYKQYFSRKAGKAASKKA